MRTSLAVSFLLVAFSGVQAGKIHGVGKKAAKFDRVANAIDGDYSPCKRQVTLFYDFSSDISADLFGKLKDFVEQTAFSKFNNFERLVLGGYSKSVIQQTTLGHMHNVGDVLAFVERFKQSRDTSDIGFLFRSLVGQDPTDLPRTIIILAGKLDDADAKAADQYVETLKRQGVFISILGIQSSVDVKTLDKLADYSYVFDLNTNIPGNIQDVLFKANGCK